MFPAQRIDEGQTMREKLQRGIVFVVFTDIGIEKISDDWAINRRHVDTQLVLLSSFRPQPK
jgi:hypothetical protein